MARRRNTFRLGITVIVMFLLLFFCLIYIGESDYFEADRTALVVRFRPSSGMPEIVAGSFVTCFGQKVGTVTASLIVEGEDPDHPETANQHFLEVHALVQADLNLREDCSISASGPPLGGKGTLEIINRGVSEKPLNAQSPVFGQVKGFQAALDAITAELDAEDPDSLLASVKIQLDPNEAQSIVAKIHHSLNDVNSITSNLDAELDRKRAGLLLAKIHNGLDDLNSSLSELSGLIKENRPKIDHTLDTVDHAVSVVDERIVTALADELDMGNQDSALAQARVALTQLNESLADVKEITGQAKTVVMLNKERINELVANATEASIFLRRGIKDIVAQPWKVMLKPGEAERYESDLVNATREFAEAAAHLDDSTARLKAIMDAGGGQVGSDDADLIEIQADLAKAIEKFDSAEANFWERLKNAKH